MAWELVSIKSEKVKDENITINQNRGNNSSSFKQVNESEVNVYIKKAEELLKQERYSDALMKLDNAISIASGKEKNNVISQKIKVLNVFKERGLEALSKSRLMDAISNFNFYINKATNIKTDHRFKAGVQEIINTIIHNKIIFSCNEDSVQNLLEFCEGSIPLIPPSEHIKYRASFKRYLIDYIKYISDYMNDYIKAINIINKTINYTGYNSTIEEYILNLNVRFNKYDEVLEYIDKNIASSIRNIDGRKTLTKFFYCINKSSNVSYKKKLEGILKSKDIPVSYAKDNISNNFNLNYLITNLKYMINKDNISECKEIVRCIKTYFNIYQINRNLIMDYSIKAKDYNCAINYLDYHLGNYLGDTSLVSDKAYILFKFKGTNSAILLMKDYIYKSNKEKKLDLVIKYINLLQVFSDKNNLNVNVKRELGSIENIDFILDYVLPICKDRRGISFGDVSNIIITNLSTIDDKRFEIANNVLKRYFQYDANSVTEFATKLYNEKEYKKSLNAINAYGGLNSTTFYRNTRYSIPMYKLKLNNHIALNDADNINLTCERLIDILKGNDDGDIIKIYVNNIIKSNEYNRGIDKLEQYLHSNIIRDKKITVNKYLSKLYFKNKDFKKSFECRVKSSFIRRICGQISDNRKRVIATATIVIFALLGVYQYNMFSTGAWKPLITKSEFDLDIKLLDIGQSSQISILNKVTPFYAINPEETILIDDPSIVKLEGDKIVGLKEGETVVRLLFNGEEVDWYNVIVSKPEVTNFYVDYDGDLTEVGDTVDLEFEMEFKDRREPEIVKIIESTNTSVVQVDGDRLKAVGPGYAEVNIRINGLHKKLIYQVENTINTSYTNDIRYTVVAGSYSELNKATALMDKLTRNRIESTLSLFNKDGIDYFRVITHNGITKDDANEVLENLTELGVEGFLIIYE